MLRRAARIECEAIGLNLKTKMDICAICQEGFNADEYMYLFYYFEMVFYILFLMQTAVRSFVSPRVYLGLVERGDELPNVPRNSD